MMLYLMANKRATASEIAALFEVNIRTVYRDIAIMTLAGAPILGIAGDGYQWKPPPGKGCDA